MRPSNFTALSAVSAAVDQNSIAFDFQNVVFASAQAIVTGTSTGTLILEYSDDPVNKQVGPTNWSPITGVTVSIAGAGVYALPKFDSCYQWVKVNFTHTNGAAGTLTVNIKTSGPN